MGIKGLAKLLSDEAPDCIREVPLSSLHGRKVAIDASMAIYQFLIAVRSGGPGGGAAATMLTNADGETTSHIQGLFNRTIRFLTEGIRPAFVFDGRPPSIKSGELTKRREKREKAQEALKAAEEDGNIEEQDKQSKRLVRAGEKENEDCMRLLRLMGVPVVQAPCEAEAQAAAMARAGHVYAVGTEDMDALTFRTPLLLRKMTFANASKSEIQTMDYAKALQGLDLSHEQFVDLCILLGCDYCDSIRGIGPKTALKLIREHSSIEKILPTLDRERYGIPDTWIPAEAARRRATKKAAKSEKPRIEPEKEEKEYNTEEEEEDEDRKLSAAAAAKRKQEEASENDKKDQDEEGQAKQEEDNADDDDDEMELDENAVPIYVLARKLFFEHEVLDEVDLKWEACQPEALTKFLVDEMGFNADRVQSNIDKLQKAFKATSKPQLRMDSFFSVKKSPSNHKPNVAAASAKAATSGTKRKGTGAGKATAKRTFTGRKKK